MPGKEETKGSFENLYKLGIWGLFNMYPNTGGLSSGILGGVNSVQLDYETDLKVTFVPYDTKRVYLRTFTGHSTFLLRTDGSVKRTGMSRDLRVHRVSRAGY